MPLSGGGGAPASYRQRLKYEELATATTSAFGEGEGDPVSPSSSLEALGQKIVSLSTEIWSRSKVCRVFVTLLAALGLGSAVYGSFLSRSSQGFRPAHLAWLAFFSVYAYYTETRRISGLRREMKALREKCRKLVQARRAAGLLRLEKDTRHRREHWPAPPHSGAKAHLYKDVASVDSPTARSRRVDYKSLCAQISQELLVSQRGDAATGMAAAAGAGAEGGAAAAVKARIGSLKSLFRMLSQAGPEPVKDPELYRDMHLALDELERLQQQQARAAGAGGFYCRLCLGYQAGKAQGSKTSPGGSGVTLKCGHTICKDCSHSLVESSISGAIGVPVSCPVGCNALMSPQMLRHSLSDDLFERFQRIHTVKMSLQASAPHVRSLASELAEARKGLALSRSKSRERERRNSKEKAKAFSPELTIRTSTTTSLGSGSGSRFSDTTSLLNHRIKKM